MPFFDEIDPSTVDIVLITHFHLDHAASLPYFLEKTTFKGKVYMTHPTKAIYKWLLSDFIKVSNVAESDMLYTEKDLMNSFEKIQAIDYHQQVDVDGIKFTAFNAGHVLGAAMFLVEISGVKVLYTGDYSREEDRHLKAAENPNTPLEVLICESTYGVQSHQSRNEREHRFTSRVHEIVSQGGRCLIPVFALGRAQELLLILDEFWQLHPELHNVPIYYASALAKKCMAVYQTYTNMMNDRIRKQIAISNPFIFKHISNLKSMEHFDDIGPCVMMASPGMLQNGLSRELFELWCPNKKNGTIIAGYCVEGTLAKEILSEPNEIVALSGAKIPLRMSVDYISFSAHVDFTQNSQFIDEVSPSNLVLVHGASTEMQRLKTAIAHKYEDKDMKMEIFTPRNCESVELLFRGEKMVKMIGEIALKSNNESVVDGVLVGKDFEYQLIDVADLKEFTPFEETSVTFKQYIATNATFSLIEFHIVQMFGPSQVEKSGDCLRIKDMKIEKEEEGKILLEWKGSLLNDMLADSVLAVLMNIEYSRASVKASHIPHSHAEHSHAEESTENDNILLQCLEMHFGTVKETETAYELSLNDIKVSVHKTDYSVDCEDTVTLKRVTNIVENYELAAQADIVL